MFAMLWVLLSSVLDIAEPLTEPMIPIFLWCTLSPNDTLLVFSLFKNFLWSLIRYKAKAKYTGNVIPPLECQLWLWPFGTGPGVIELRTLCDLGPFQWWFKCNMKEGFNSEKHYPALGQKMPVCQLLGEQGPFVHFHFSYMLTLGTLKR